MTGRSWSGRLPLRQFGVMYGKREAGGCGSRVKRWTSLVEMSVGWGRMTGGLVKKNYQFGSKINTGQGRLVLVDPLGSQQTECWWCGSLGHVVCHGAQVEWGDPFGSSLQLGWQCPRYREKRHQGMVCPGHRRLSHSSLWFPPLPGPRASSSSFQVCSLRPPGQSPTLGGIRAL